MIELIFTIDYEIYLGKYSGTVEKLEQYCLVILPIPNNRIITQYFNETSEKVKNACIFEKKGTKWAYKELKRPKPI